MPDRPLPARTLDGLAFAHAPDATLLLADRIILRASLKVAAVFGWTSRELEGQPIRMLYPGQTDYELIGQRAREAMLTAEVYEDQRFMRHRSGQLIWMAGRGSALDPAAPEKLAVWSYRPLSEDGPRPSLLTPTERKVAGYLVNGFTSKEIAQALGSAPRTVEVHRASMIRKFKVRNSSDLVRRLLTERGNGG